MHTQSARLLGESPFPCAAFAPAFHGRHQAWPFGAHIQECGCAGTCASPVPAPQFELQHARQWATRQRDTRRRHACVRRAWHNWSRKEAVRCSAARLAQPPLERVESGAWRAPKPSSKCVPCKREHRAAAADCQEKWREISSLAVWISRAWPCAAAGVLAGGSCALCTPLARSLAGGQAGEREELATSCALCAGRRLANDLALAGRPTDRQQLRARWRRLASWAAAPLSSPAGCPATSGEWGRHKSALCCAPPAALPALSRRPGSAFA